MFPIIIGFACGAITATAVIMMLTIHSRSNDYTLDLLNDVLSDENDRLVSHCEQLSQSLSQNAQALRERDDEIECLRRKAFYYIHN